jgi:MTH538 TIR-like domain (DUF1863).
MKKEKIVIVHNNKHNEQLEEIKQELEKDDCEIKEIEIGDLYVPEEGIAENLPVDVPEEVEEILDWLEALIVLIDEETYEDEFIDVEIEEAYRRGKSVIGIYAKGCNEDVILPSSFKIHRNYTLSPDSLDKLSDALRGISIPHEEIDGSKSKRTYKIHRVKCNKK